MVDLGSGAASAHAGAGGGGTTRKGKGRGGGGPHRLAHWCLGTVGWLGTTGWGDTELSLHSDNGRG
jgi:hypothetical protein